MPPQFAMWVLSDADIWKLWIVPPPKLIDKHEFYRRASEVIAKHRADLGDVTISDIEMQAASQPAISAMFRVVRMEGFGGARFAGTTFNGYYLPDAVVLRSAAAPAP